MGGEEGRPDAGSTVPSHLEVLPGCFWVCACSHRPQKHTGVPTAPHSPRAAVLPVFSHGIQVGGTCRLTVVRIHVFLELLMCSHFPCAYGLLRPLCFYKSQAQLMYKKKLSDHPQGFKGIKYPYQGTESCQDPRSPPGDPSQPQSLSSYPRDNHFLYSPVLLPRA